MLNADFFSQSPLVCARELVGCELRWDRCSGVIVETEAYTALGDEACHTFLRRGAQTFVDTHPAGTAYIYLNYGVHWLLNVLIKGEMDGFVLIRALEPGPGQTIMQERRGLDDPIKLCSGPGKLTQALALLPAFHGSSLCHDPRRAFHGRPPEAVKPDVVSDVRIGISRAADLPWRFLLAGSRYVSRPPQAGCATVLRTVVRTPPKKAGPSPEERPGLLRWRTATRRQHGPADQPVPPTPRNYLLLVVVVADAEVPEELVEAFA